MYYTPQCDYSERYDGAQSQVLSLSSRLEELTEYAKEKDSRATELDSKHKRLADNLHLAHKVQFGDFFKSNFYS